MGGSKAHPGFNISVTMRAAYRALVAICLLSGCVLGGPITPGGMPSSCDQYFFYDHGTDHCEPCGDICDKADYMGTVDNCWDMCRRKLWSLFFKVMLLVRVIHCSVSRSFLMVPETRPPSLGLTELWNVHGVTYVRFCLFHCLTSS